MNKLAEKAVFPVANKNCSGSFSLRTGAKDFCTGAKTLCTGAQVFCTGAQTKRTGAFLPFFGFFPQSLAPKSASQGAQHISFTNLLIFKTQNYG
jgi:hypothetical protein